MAQLASALGQIPLEMATESRVVIEDAEHNRIRPLAVGLQHAQRAVMKIQMPQAIDIFALVAANLPGLVAMLGRLGSRTVNRTQASPLEEPMTFHITPERGVGRHGPSLGLLFHQDGQVVGMQLVAPTGMLPMLLGDQLDEPRRQRGMLPVIGADLAFERVHRSNLGAESFVIPALDGREPEEDPGAGDGVAPLLGG